MQFQYLSTGRCLLPRSKSNEPHKTAMRPPTNDRKFAKVFVQGDENSLFDVGTP